MIVYTIDLSFGLKSINVLTVKATQSGGYLKIKSFSFIPQDAGDSDFNNFMTRILFVSV